MIPFNLTEYLKCTTRKVVTRDGKSVSIIEIDHRDYQYPIKAIIDDKQTLTYDRDGHVLSLRDSSLDLFFESGLYEKWANIYDIDGEYHIGPILYDSKKEAKTGNQKHPDYVKTIKVIWEE